MLLLKRLPGMATLSVAFALSLAHSVLGWGPVGHETIATIAQVRLSRAALRGIDAILEGQDDLVGIANWADQIRDSEPKTKAWHFIDLPVRRQMSSGDVGHFCPARNCVIARIRDDKRVLASSLSSRQEKFRALKFLIHLVGDLHQPLHVADDDDHGGNDKIIRFDGEPIALHALWDGLIEKRANENPRKFGQKLAAQMTEARIQKWFEGNETAWALEGYKIAKENIYKNYSPGPGQLTDINLGGAYYRKMRPIVEERLQKAGARLAKILEQILGNNN